MSRIGKAPVAIPQGVDVQVSNGSVTAKGKNGQLSMMLTSDVGIDREDGQLVVKPLNETKRARAMWGTTRANLNNLLVGVSEGFTIDLEITGVGYRAAVQGKTLQLQLGFSHDVNYPIPEGIAVTCERPTAISISGADRQKIGQFAAEVRSFRPPEPYKGKGVRYADEHIVRKEGKKK